MVVGVGAIGRQVALQLAAVGVPSMTLVDFDAVEPVNLAPQGYRPDQIDSAKVDATARDCRMINPGVRVEASNGRFRKTTLRSFLDLHVRPVVFACVDSIGVRSFIWDAVTSARPSGDGVLFVDGRMAADVVRVMAAEDAEGHRHYGTTLFEESEAYAGACTTRSSIYASSVAAGLMVHQMAMWLRGLRVVRDQTLNMIGAELTTAGD